jgi:Putative peptidoglycan binding domain
MGALVERVKTKALSAGWPAAALAALALGGVSDASGAPRPKAPYSTTYYSATYRRAEAEAVSLSLDARVVRQVQAALRQRGYYTGTVTGFMGDETQNAIQRFQIDHCAARVWPLIDPWLLVGLGIRAGSWAARNRPLQEG